jgi:nitrite reductase/ring-hydroxylating ferredoxin subunit
MAEILVVCSEDPLVTGALADLAGELGMVVSVTEAQQDPAVVVIDLERPDALAEVSRWRERCPEAFIAGHLGVPDRQLWLDAERAGCDLVANRGALARALRRRLAEPRRRQQRVPLFSAADAAGRLGLVHRDADSPVGPLAVYHLGGSLYAVEDRCPHAGAVLSEGELDGAVVTCPRHGSQFDVRDGDRLRGPADVPLRTFPLLEESGFVYLLTDNV